MATSIEIEAKALLTKKEYNKVLKYFRLDVVDGYIQKNYYIDTEKKDLRKLGLSLRVRRLNGYVMSFKLPMAEGLLEKTQTLTREQFEDFESHGKFPEGDISDFVESLYINPCDLKIIATLTTLRIEQEYEDLTLAIDENRYGDTQDFELEMEATSMKKAQNLLKKVCDEVGITYKENLISKQKRAMDALSSVE
ncbi:MAG: CYTH domain protein [Tenericutes bacterium ADurb.Bin239]|nr:MAG: CYTH domain protein [Tenericutes bacterium ADurb.Bin239]